MMNGSSDVFEDCGRPPLIVLLVPVLLSVVWVTFQLFYGSWVLAFLITKLANVFLKDSGIYIGSIHINLLAGRVIFTHLHYYCRDYSIRVSSGCASVRWCRSSAYCCKNTNSLKQASFVFIQLNGLEYHWYNRSENYDRYGKSQGSELEPVVETEESAFWRWWKETQPALHFSILKGRVLLGNHHLERSLVLYFAKAEAHYSTNQASTPLDELMHSVDWTSTNVKVVLERSEGYSKPPSESPPAEACDGNSDNYNLFKTDSANILFSQDSPGLVPLGQTTPPKYALDVTLGSSTTINYGCYANRQRRELQSFFFPVDKVEQTVSREPQAGERRVHSVFDISVSLISPALFKLLFSIEESLHHLSFTLGTHSKLGIHVPWLTAESGSKSVVDGDFSGLCVHSSLPYPSLGSADSVSFRVDLHFPRVWNGIQEWKMKFHGRKVHANIMFAYIDFINALLDDWVGNEPNDLLDFVPINWSINFDLSQYEIFLFTNRYNWLDLFGGEGLENTRLAFCGSTGQIAFKLPFTQFLPLKQLVHFSAKGQDLVVRHYAPPSSATRESLFALSAANRHRWRIMEPTFQPPSAKTKTILKTDMSSTSSGQQPSSSNPPSLQCSPSVSLVSSHSMAGKDQHKHIISAPVMGGIFQDPSPLILQDPSPLKLEGKEIGPQPAKSSSPQGKDEAMEAELKEKEFFPMGYRYETLHEDGWVDIACGPQITINIDYSSHHHDPQSGDHTPLLPSVVDVDIEAADVLIRVFGCLARDLLGLKENYPGEYVKMTPFSSVVPASDTLGLEKGPAAPLKEAPLPQHYNGSHQPELRTINIFVKFRLRNIVAEFPTDLAQGCPKGFPLPSLCTDLLSVQVEYSAADTKVWLHVDPISIHLPSVTPPTSPLSPLSPPTHDLGHVVINSVNLNCHGFTEFMCQERVEYAWMMQLLIGRITGALSSQQLLIALDWLYTMFIHTYSVGDALQVSPNGEVNCPKTEPISEEIKYRLFQLDIAEADLHICEAETITRLQSPGFDLDLCMLHVGEDTLGLSFQLHAATLTGYLADANGPALQLQVGLFDVGCIHGNLSLREPMDSVPERQLQFLKEADLRTRRLWFLWAEGSGPVHTCGCCGNCQFMDGCIERRLLTEKSQSAVYCSPFPSFPSFPRHFGMPGLNQTLQQFSISELGCLHPLHKGLLDHYQLRYGGEGGGERREQVVPRASTHGSTHVDQDTRSSRISCTDSFVSARSSWSSLLPEDFISLENINAQVSAEASPHKFKHRKKPSQLNIETAPPAPEETDRVDYHSLESEYGDFVASQYLQTFTLQIPHQKRTASEAPSNYRVHHRKSASDISFMMEMPQAPSCGSIPTSFRVPIPCLAAESAGSIPIITHKESFRTLDRRRQRLVHIKEESGPSAKVSLSVSVVGANTLLVAPPILQLIGSVTKSVEAFFKGRSAISILNWVSHSAGVSASNRLSNLKPSGPPSDTPPPLLHLHVNMSHGAHIAIQLVQNAKAIHRDAIPENLNAIASHKSLVTLFTSGLDCSCLLQNSSELEKIPSLEEETLLDEGEKHKVRVNSWRISLELKCPVLQVDLCALVPGTNEYTELPGLIPGQQQLDFNLTQPLPPPPDAAAPHLHHHPYIMCDLLEAGLKDAKISCAARIGQSEVRDDLLLTWESLTAQAGTSSLGSAGKEEVRCDQVGVSVLVPLVWSQLCSHPCGLPAPTSSGLDCLIIMEAVEVWHEAGVKLVDSIMSVLMSKAEREKHVLLTLLCNAARSYPQGKPFNSALAEIPQMYRKTVLFCCLYQTWEALSVFSEIHVPTMSVADTDSQLIAVALALASKLYLLQGSQRMEKRQQPVARGTTTPPLPRDADQCSEVTVGYVSISPSPSDMGMPNRLHANRRYLEEEEEHEDISPFSQMDYNVLFLLREALNPLFAAVGITLERHTGAVSLNSAHFSIHFTVELKEATLFSLEHLQRKPSSSPTTAVLTSHHPALLLEQILINGYVKRNSELESSTSWSRSTLLPLAESSALTHSSPAKVGVVSNCCVAVDNVHGTITAPLLKLIKHVSVTGKLRRKALKQAKMAAMDAGRTPVPPPSAPPVSMETGQHISKYASSIVTHLSVLEETITFVPTISIPTIAVPSDSSPVLETDGILHYNNSPHPLRHVSPVGGCGSPNNRRGSYSDRRGSQGVDPTLDYSLRSSNASNTFLLRQSSSSLSSTQDISHSVTIAMEDTPYGTSLDDGISTMDTCGEDTTTDSQHILSSDVEGLPSQHSRNLIPPTSMASPSFGPDPSPPKATPTRESIQSLGNGLTLPETNLFFTIFGLLKLGHVKCELQIETTRASLELVGVSASMDTRDSTSKDSLTTLPDSLSFLSQYLPTYISMAVTIKKAIARAHDRALPDNDLIQMVLMPIYGAIGISNSPPLIPTYRCLLKLASLQVDIKQSAVKVHKRFQQLMPSFTKIYHEIFGVEVGVIPPSEFSAATSSEQVLRVDSIIKLPSKIPQGFVHLSLDKAVVYVAPLPSLSVTYAVSPLSVKAQTNHVISFQLVIGEHVLRFNPKEQYKDEISLRSLTLPRLQLHGKVQRSKKNRTPRVTLDLSMKQMNIDLTTDVLNQLLIVQNTFIKELNELLQMLTSIGESLPYKERPAPAPVVEGGGGEGFNLVTLLSSCHVSLGGVVITVSTPLSTAIRFSTGKIEMTLSNTSTQPWPWKSLPASAKNQLSLDGRVDIDINLALGYLQDVGPDVVEDLCELAYFRTRVSVRNTLQNLPGSKEAEEQENAVDTFLISILSPHLYLQSSAVEQAILFWLNCKSVYSYWLNERKLLNVEIMEATEALLEKFQRPTQFQTPSIDFSKPRLVQITVTDLGTCMPIVPVPPSHHNTKKPFPALVVTIKEMQFLLNLSHKVASSGRFQTFCVRYAEQFSLRHKIWTLDLKKHKLTNYGTITRGTFRLCLATTKRLPEKEPNVAVGDKFLCAFQWDMSGINVHANTDIGHHTSTLVRTMTTITTDMEGQGKNRNRRGSSSQPSPKSQSSRLLRKASGASKSLHRRSLSMHRPSQADTNYKIALEQELAKQTRKLQKLRYSGASGESLRTEEDILRNTEQELAKTVQKMFRHPRTGISLQKFNQIFSPWPVNTGSHERMGSSVHRRLSTVVRKKLFSLSDKVPEAHGGDSTSSSPVHPPTRGKRMHRRYRSDVTGMMMMTGGSDRATSPAPTPFSEKEGGGGNEEEEDKEDDEELFNSSRDGAELGASQDTGQEGFSIPSIDIDFNVTVNVDHGKVVLRTEEHTKERHSNLMAHSPFLHPHGNKPDHKHFVESVLLIPALTVKAHYQSLVGASYSNPIISSTLLSSPLQQSASAPIQLATTTTTNTSPPSHNKHHHQQPLPLPVKRGVLSLSAVVESLPEDIKLTHSLLEFIEQVARPTLAATVVSSSSSTESLSEQEGKPGEKGGASSMHPISFPVDVTLTFHIQPSTVYLTCQPHSKVECIIQSPNVNFVISFSLFSHQILERPPLSLDRPSPTSSTIDPNSRAVFFNNLYITGCLTTFLLQLYSPQVSTLKSGAPTVENKEALSLTLGQALLHFSRKSVLTPLSHKGSSVDTHPAATSVDDYDTHSKMQVSVIINIASVLLGYDMRRLNDITAFRRWWYRTSLVEALFIGSKKSPEDDGPPSASQSQVAESSDESTASVVANLDNTISAAIVVAATVDDFRVAANFAQVMGNADLLVTYLNCEAHCDVSHNELVLFQLECSLKKGEFDARAGVIAGSILMKESTVHVLTQSQQGCTPEHRGRAAIQLVEGRVDYMSSCIALARATNLNVEGSDIWKGLNLIEGEGGGGEQENEPEFANIQVQAHFSWNELQLSIHRATTKHFFNIVEKMSEFVMQQKRRSERTLSNMLPAGSAASKALEAYRKEQQKTAEKDSTSIKEDPRHHWLWAVRVGSIELMHILGIQPPKDAHHEVSLGGNITIHGDNVCIVCFHGPSFRDKERVVFNIDQVEASFSTQAIPGLGRWQADVGIDPMQNHIRTCQQIVLVKLGEEGQGARTADLVSIHRVSTERARVPNISGNSIRDWLAYACIDSFLHKEKYVSDSSTLVRISRKLSIQAVLMVPAFRVELINDHFWPLVDHVVPRVECTLTSVFSEGISVTTTVDHYLFLHDVIKGYVDYHGMHRRRTTEISTGGEIGGGGSGGASLSDREEVGRHFECVCWELNPHLRLMTAVSGQFNPHFSWLLEKLGLLDAQTTIPKWIQRGAMDPLDKIVATAVELLVKLTASKKKNLILQVTSQ